MLIEKFKAASIHLALSFIILSLFFSLLIFIWFPEPFFTATGGWQGLKLVALIDLVLGPLLTFIVYNSQKKASILNRDLSVIVFLQLTVLIFGIHTVYSQRPLAIVYWQNSFKTVSANEVNQRYFDSIIHKEIYNSPLQFFIVKNPSSLQEKKEMLKLIDEKNIAPHQQLNLYKKLKNEPFFLKQNSTNIDKAIQQYPGIKEQINSILINNNSKMTDYLFIPLVSKYQNIFLVFNHQQQFIDHIKIPSK